MAGDAADGFRGTEKNRRIGQPNEPQRRRYAAELKRRKIDSPAHRRRVGSFLAAALKFIVSVGLVRWLVHRLGVDALVSRLSAVSPKWLIAALTVFAVSNMLGALQWHLLLKMQKTDIAFARSLALYHVGLFFNNFLISNIGGDAVRIYDIKKHSGRGAVAVSSVLFDRIIGFTAMAVIATVAAVFQVGFLSELELWAIGAVLFLWLGVLIVLFSSRIGVWLQKRLHRRFPEKFVERLKDVYRGIHTLRYNPDTAVKLVFIAPSVQFLRILTHYFAALSVGAQTGISFFFLFIPLVALFASLPISFGGIGVREQSAAVLFAQAGLAAPQVVAFEFLAYLVGIFASIPGGIVFVLRKTIRK